MSDIKKKTKVDIESGESEDGWTRSKEVGAGRKLGRSECVDLDF